MLKNNFTRLLTVLSVSTGLSIVVLVITQSFNTTETTANASSLSSDGPWEIDNQGTPMYQSLHNGNQIYYSIAPNDKYTKLFQHAVSDWNALGVINLVQVPWDDASSQITMQTNKASSDAAYDDADSDTDGLTTFSNITAVNNVATIGQAQVTLYSSISDNTKVYQQVVTEHEIGHALGFDHDNRKFKSNGKKYRHYKLTMAAEGDDTDKYYRLGGIEQHMLADHYHLTPSVDLSNINC